MADRLLITCDNCGLPDIHRGQGDGIGSCDCPRCDCCRAAPRKCDCARDVGDAEEIDELGDDYLCNDLACPTRVARAESQALRSRVGGSAAGAPNQGGGE